MSIKYKVIPKQIPGQNQPFYFALAVSQKTVSLDKIAELISDGSTLRRADVYASLVAMVDVMKRELEIGNTVQLGDLGKFSIAIKSTPCIEPSEVNAHKIKERRLLYRPSLHLKKFLKTLKFTKLKTD